MCSGFRRLPSGYAVDPLGLTVGLFSGLFFAGYSLMGKEAARQKINP